MITDAIETEKTGLWGRAYIDGAHNSTPVWALAITGSRKVRDQLHKVGGLSSTTNARDFPERLSDDGLRSVLRMVTDKIAGPFTQPDFQFVPGAVAVHIHSSARALPR